MGWLVEKHWCAFRYKFRERSGHADPNVGSDQKSRSLRALRAHGSGISGSEAGRDGNANGRPDANRGTADGRLGRRRATADARSEPRWSAMCAAERRIFASLG